MCGISLIPCSFYKQTPRNDFLDGEWTGNAREFVGVVRVLECAQSLDRWNDWWWYNFRVRANVVGESSGTDYGANAEDQNETRVRLVMMVVAENRNNRMRDYEWCG